MLEFPKWRTLRALFLTVFFFGSRPINSENNSLALSDCSLKARLSLVFYYAKVRHKPFP